MIYGVPHMDLPAGVRGCHGREDDGKLCNKEADAHGWCKKHRRENKRLTRAVKRQKQAYEAQAHEDTKDAQNEAQPFGWAVLDANIPIV